MMLLLLFRGRRAHAVELVHEDGHLAPDAGVKAEQDDEHGEHGGDDVVGAVLGTAEGRDVLDDAVDEDKP